VLQTNHVGTVSSNPFSEPEPVLLVTLLSGKLVDDFPSNLRSGLRDILRIVVSLGLRLTRTLALYHRPDFDCKNFWPSKFQWNFL